MERTTKIIPTEVFEWVKVKTTTKSVKTINKSVCVSSRKEQECVEVIAEFKDKDYTFYVPVEDIRSFESNHDYRTARLYHEDGTRVMGTWRHGRTGEKKHIEPVCYNLEGKYIIAVADYNSGFIRNNHKYLLRINS